MARLLWDVRDALTQELTNKVQKVVDDNQKKESYYLLVFPNWENNDHTRLNTKIRLMSYLPPKMLGTLCYYVNNKKGLIDLLWELPMDIDFVGEFKDEHNLHPDVMKSIKGIEGVIQIS